MSSPVLNTTKISDRADRDYQYDANQITTLETQKPWTKDPRFFKRCRVSGLSAMKMLEHALQGVAAGQRKGGKPLEIMGLLLGKADGDAIVVMDTFPLPVEGTETKVMADDERVSKYMIDLSEQLEQTRKERLIGWYHSHPFDVGTESNCFLSATDVQTQQMWQVSLDGKWIAIVLDPLRSLAKQIPEMMCFRVYPPAFSPPTGECPDGVVIRDEALRNGRWGKLHSRYYCLSVEYFISSLGRNLLEILSRNHLWVRVLSSAATMEPEYRVQIADRVTNLSSKIRNPDFQSLSSGKLGKLKSSEGSTEIADVKKVEDPATRAAIDLATEQCEAHIKQVLKDTLFN